MAWSQGRGGHGGHGGHEETLTEGGCIAKTADTKNTPINDCQLTSQQIHCDIRFMSQFASHCVSELFTSYSARMHHQTLSRAEQRPCCQEDMLWCSVLTCHSLTNLSWCLLHVRLHRHPRVMAISQFHFRYKLINGSDVMLHHYSLHLRFTAFQCFVTFCKFLFLSCSAACCLLPIVVCCAFLDSSLFSCKIFISSCINLLIGLKIPVLPHLSFCILSIQNDLFSIHLSKTDDRCKHY